MGAFTAIYGFLVAFWGAAIVLFLLGWIKTSSKYEQDLWVGAFDFLPNVQGMRLKRANLQRDRVKLKMGCSH